MGLSDEILRLYWYWAAERQNIFFARLAGQPEPYTDDPILQEYKFTNAFRASDRTSQYLIRYVIYPQDNIDYSPEDTVFRVLLFKRFNLISTWQWIAKHFFPVMLEGFELDRYVDAFEQLHEQVGSVYSTAYNAGRVQGPHPSKYGNHLLALKQAERSGLFQRILEANSLRRVANLIQDMPGVGSWLAYQYSIDLNYTPYINFSEDSYVSCGPGARSGITKCYGDIPPTGFEDAVRHMVDSQDWLPAQYGYDFKNLFGRPLHLIDCQNIFCELAKYTRISHPHLGDKRKTVRFRFVYDPNKPKVDPFYPPKWGLDTSNLPPA
ncbi:hypothetical protein AAU61_01230 [Desulfocarbo indianensis]|nr:hypothetical protein AAU61_01230 [Desulfocarbo indianensis]